MRKCVLKSLMVVVFFLSACSGNEETIKFEDKSFANTLFIQKIENNSTSEALTKTVADKDKIKEVLSMVEGIKVEKINSDNFLEKLKAQSSYMFGFLKGDGMNTEKGKYAFTILEDGTILFNYASFDNPGTPLITTEKHNDLLNELKQTLEMNF